MKKYLGFDDLLAFCKMMSASQGFYGRIYRMITELTDEDKEQLEKYLKERKFTDTLDFVYWLECEE